MTQVFLIKTQSGYFIAKGDKKEIVKHISKGLVSETPYEYESRAEKEFEDYVTEQKNSLAQHSSSSLNENIGDKIIKTDYI